MKETPRFLQIHTLHSYFGALLNRDEQGFAKRMTVGNAVRTRISSQCLKRHWRTAADHQHALHNIPGVADSIRSRNTVERMVMAPLTEPPAAAEEVLAAVTAAFNAGVYGASGETQAGRQPLLLGYPEVQYLREKAAAVCAEHPDDAEAAAAAVKDLFSVRNGEERNFRALREQTRLPGGLTAALFGRMVTSDPAANIDAAIHVAHAFTVHREEVENDYFTVVDDLQRDDEDAGAAHIGETELTSGLFYGYVVVDIPALVSNLEGCHPNEWREADRELAGQVVQRLIRIIATVSPGAKVGSTAPYGYAPLMLLEAGASQPRSLADAFRSPARAQTDSAAAKLAQHLANIDQAYETGETRKVMSLEDWSVPNAERLTLPSLADWAGAVVRQGEVEPA